MNDTNELIKQYEAMKIGIDEPFKFHCTQCGKCCINQNDIILTPMDLFRIAKKFECSMEEVLDEYCDTYIGHDSRIPVVWLKPQGSMNHCPFLQDNKCSIHDVKPARCAMFPIGRMSHATKKKENVISFEHSQTDYIFLNPQCGDDTEQHTVREWLHTFGIPLKDDYNICWNSTICTLSLYMRAMEKEISDPFMMALWGALLSGLYLNYDKNQDFLPQFQKRSERILNAVKMIASAASVVLE